MNHIQNVCGDVSSKFGSTAGAKTKTQVSMDSFRNIATNGKIFQEGKTEIENVLCTNVDS